ncbi:MAG: DUF167 domain-containing protein [Betaproteobacteria bacterium]|nr:MAG: DUF167 domain-containing protein [Betaproteobacteria bacterium]
MGESLRAAGPGVRCDHAAVPAPAAPLRAAGGKRRSDPADRPGHPAGAADSNAALIEFLADYFGVPKRNVRITGGLKSRRKRVLIKGAQWTASRS